jgi:hypothetical protein
MNFAGLPAEVVTNLTPESQTKGKFAPPTIPARLAGSQ